MAAGATSLYYEYNNSGEGADASERGNESSISADVTKKIVPRGDSRVDWGQLMMAWDC